METEPCKPAGSWTPSSESEHQAPCRHQPGKSFSYSICRHVHITMFSGVFHRVQALCYEAINDCMYASQYNPAGLMQLVQCSRTCLCLYAEASSYCCPVEYQRRHSSFGTVALSTRKHSNTVICSSQISIHHLKLQNSSMWHQQLDAAVCVGAITAEPGSWLSGRSLHTCCCA